MIRQNARSMSGELTQRRYCLNSDQFVIEDFEERTAIVNLSSGKYYAVWGDKSRAIFSVICKGLSIEDIMISFGPDSFVSVHEMKSKMIKYVELLNELHIIKLNSNPTAIRPIASSLLYDHPQIEIYDQGEPFEKTTGDLNQLDDDLRGYVGINTVDFAWCNYAIADTPFKVGYSHEELMSFFHPVIAHLQDDFVGQSDLTIHVCLVDQRSFEHARTLLETTDWHLRTAATLKKLIFSWDGIIQVYNPKNHNAYYIVESIEKMPNWESSFSFRDILNWHFENTSIQFLHGAGLSINGKGVLISGVGGSGKSTTTMTGLLHGFQTVGDDFILVDVDQKRMYSVYSFVKLRQDGVELLMQYTDDSIVAKSVFQEHNQKFHLDLSVHYADHLTSRSSVDAILIPKVSMDKSPRIEVAEKEKVLAEILLSTLYLLHGYKQKISAKVKSIVSATPCYYFHLSKDLNENAKLLNHFMMQNI